MAKLPVSLPPLRYVALVLVGILVVVGGGYYIYANVWTKSPFGPTKATSDAQAAAAAATSTAGLTEEQIVSQVGKIMLLPNDEMPTLAKVSDPAVLQSQEFFKNAVIGDVVLMYAKSLRAILYDPVQNKIIEVGPITEATTTATSTAK